jgi:hypothetical protein
MIKAHITKNNIGPQPGMEFVTKFAIRGFDKEPRHRRPCSYRVRVADAMIKVKAKLPENPLIPPYQGNITCKSMVRRAVRR